MHSQLTNSTSNQVHNSDVLRCTSRMVLKAPFTQKPRVSEPPEVPDEDESLTQPQEYPMSPWMADAARHMSASDNDDLGGDDMEEGTLSGIRRSAIPQVNAQTTEQENYELQTFMVMPTKRATYKRRRQNHS